MMTRRPIIARITRTTIIAKTLIPRVTRVTRTTIIT